jgi:hypothetical protein
LRKKWEIYKIDKIDKIKIECVGLVCRKNGIKVVNARRPILLENPMREATF